MNFKTWKRAIALTLFAAVVIPVQLAAQSNHHEYHHYQLVDVGTFGGPSSSNAWAGFYTKTMNSKGAVLGEANTSYTADPYCLFFPVNCFMVDAFEWHNGVLTDLTGLPGNVNGTYAAGINSRGWVTGISGNGAIDPLTGYPQMEAVVWKHGKGIDLGTLGGNGSAAYGTNDRGQIVGGALNQVPDNFSTGFPAPSCGGQPCILESNPALFFPSATQVHAVLWQNGTMKDLGTLGGPDSFAWQINASGEIAGQSYLDSVPNASTGVPTTHPFFIGHDGKMVDVGSLGGTASWVGGLNNRGQMIGGMTLPGDAGWHPFLWSNGVLKDLGTLGADCGMATSINDVGDVVGTAYSTGTLFSATLWRDGVLIDLGTAGADRCAEAYSINSHGQVVGESGDCGGPLPNHGWVWQDSGPVVDLNSLIVPSSPIRFSHAVFINDRGEISGDGYLTNGDVHAIVLIPCDDDHPDVSGCDYDLIDAETAAMQSPAPHYVPSATRPLPQSWRSNRYHIPAIVGGAAALTSPVSPEPDFTRPPVFYVSATPLTPSSVSPGGSSTSSVTAGFTNGAGAGTVVTLTCSVQPSPPLAPTCSISPASYTFGGTPSTLTVSTVGPSGRLLSRPGSGLLYALWLPLIGVVGVGVGVGSNSNGRKGKLKTALPAGALFLGLAFQFACGGGGKSSPGTPAGMYEVTVTATGFIPVASTSSLTTLQVQ